MMRPFPGVAQFAASFRAQLQDGQPGESSMYMSSFDSVFDASAMAPQSPSAHEAGAQIFDRLTRASAHRIR